jgi:kumamolisin
MNSTFELSKSSRSEPEGATAIGDVDRDAQISVTVHLRDVELADRSTSPIDLFRRFAACHHLALRQDPTRRSICLEGNVSRLSQAFGTSMHLYSDGICKFRARSGPLSVPEELAPWTLAVLGLDERPIVRRPLFAAAARADSEGFWPPEITTLYGLSSELDAPGQCVGIIALGGSYDPDDLAIAAQSANRRLPLVVPCPVNGMTSLFGNNEYADQETTLDLQVVATLVPSARIAVYFAENKIASLVDAIRTAVSDDVNRPTVLSISWGSAEKFWADSDIDAVQSALSDASKRGITVVAAAGDSLATAGLLDEEAHVLFPASSPLVLACGGTQVSLDETGAIADEEVWHMGSIGTGGGISNKFSLPDFQRNASVPGSYKEGKIGRGVPDVSATASKNPGYRVIYKRESIALDGTSATAPLWASLIAMANSKRGGSLGAVHSFLYANSILCRQVNIGNNRLNEIGYDARPGWNPCTGLGVPNKNTVDRLASAPFS